MTMSRLHLRIGLCAVVYMFFGLVPKAISQQGTDPTWGLSVVTCLASTQQVQTILVVHPDTPPIAVFCRDSVGPSTFGDAIEIESGACDNGVALPDTIAHVGWMFCLAPLIGETEGGFGGTVANVGSFECPVLRFVGQITGQARVFNFLLNKLLSEGQEGFA